MNEERRKKSTILSFIFMNCLYCNFIGFLHHILISQAKYEKAVGIYIVFHVGIAITKRERESKKERIIHYDYWNKLHSKASIQIQSEFILFANVLLSRISLIWFLCFFFHSWLDLLFFSQLFYAFFLFFHYCDIFFLQEHFPILGKYHECLKGAERNLCTNSTAQKNKKKKKLQTPS